MNKIKKVKLCHVFKPGEFEKLKKLILRGKNPIDYLARRGFIAQKGPEDPFLPEISGNEMWVFKRGDMAFCVLKCGGTFVADSIKAITPAQTDGEKP